MGLLCIFSIVLTGYLVNLNYVAYNEVFLLGFLFIIFFIIIIKSVNKNVQWYMFKQTFKYFFFNVIIFRGIISLNRILIYIYVLKIYLCQHTKSIFVRLKKKSIIYIKVILNKLLSIYNYLYKLCIKKIKKWYKSNQFSYHFYFLLKKIKNDNLFY